MPVSELDIANSLFWLFGYGPSDERGRELAGRLNLALVRDAGMLRRLLLCSDEFRRAADEAGLRPPNRPLDRARPRLIFLHVPKCAGTTLHSVLEQHFASGDTCPERFNALRAYRLGELAGFTFLSGHFDLESCLAVAGPQTKIVTMLREPRARLLSMYHFLRIHRPEAEPETASMVTLARSQSAEGFFSHPAIRRHAAVRDGMTSLLVQPHKGVRWESLDNQLQDTDLVIADPAEAARQALAALEGMSGFGLVEEFARSLEVLGQTLGLHLVEGPPQQVTDEMRTRPNLDNVERPPMTERLRELLDDLTQADRALYADATALFARRHAALSPAPVPAGAALTVGSPRAIPLDAFHPLEARRDGDTIVASGTAGVLAAGPYLTLTHGRYRLACHFVLPAAGDTEPAFSIDVWHNRGRAKCQSVRWTGPSPAVVDFALSYDVPDMEFVVRVGADSRFELLAVDLHPVSSAVAPPVPS